LKVKILKEHTDQSTGKKLKPGYTHEYSNDFDLSHALAFKNAELLDSTKIERAVDGPPETRKRRTQRKKPAFEFTNGAK